MKKFVLATFACLFFAMPAFAQILDAKSILLGNSDKWVSIRSADGKDYVSFFPLVGWRCELNSVYYGINGSSPKKEFKMEKCDKKTKNNPFKLHITEPAGSVYSMTVVVEFKDGSISKSVLLRPQMLLN